MREETLRELIAEYKGNDLAGYLTGCFAWDNNVRQRMAQHHKWVEEEAERHAGVTRKQHDCLLEIRRQCPHHDQVYRAGTTDAESYWECELCGSEILQ